MSGFARPGMNSASRECSGLHGRHPLIRLMVPRRQYDKDGHARSVSEYANDHQGRRNRRPGPELGVVDDAHCVTSG